MRETDYEQRRVEYEHTLLSELRKVLLKPKSQARRELEKPRTRVEDIRIDTFEVGRQVVILFRDLDRPECLFGFAWGPLEVLADTAEIDATICWANFDETLYASDLGLPKECSPEGINWV